MRSVAERLERIFDNTKVDRIVITNTTLKDVNFVYLTGLYASGFESSILVADRKRATLITTVLEYDVAKKVCPKEVKVIAASSRNKTYEFLKKQLRDKTVGINGAFLPYNLYGRMKELGKPKKLVDVSTALSAARQIKDKEEIELMRVANRIAMKAFAEVHDYLKEGVTERKIAETFEELMKKHGADSPSFPTIVCFGANSAVPHHVPGNTKLTRNSFVLIDAGASYMGYCSDVTRTYIFKPDKSSAKYKRMIEMYNTVKKAQSLALKSIKPGEKCETPHIVAAKFIDNAFGGRYKGRFIHGLGHSIGLDVHDAGPSLRPGDKSTIKENMVFSDEPGIYIEGFGGVRIEDDVLVAKNGGWFI